MKYNNTYDYIGISVTKSKRMTRITIFERSNGEIFKLSQYINQKYIIEENKWYTMRIN